MLLYFTDATNQKQVAVNPTVVGAVFEVPEGPHVGKTAINTTIGSIIVEQSVIDVVGTLNGALA